MVSGEECELICIVTLLACFMVGCEINGVKCATCPHVSGNNSQDAILNV